uniref:Uncharacterized protein n=1 Tax=Phlebotomus papatasi TaxID=29031 RepID=A0A1B0DDY9_PHLPP
MEINLFIFGSAISGGGGGSSIGVHGDDDSQQAAEAMVQLSGIGFYNQPQDESIDLDPNYDPSDFLGMTSSSSLAPQRPPQLSTEVQPEASVAAVPVPAAVAEEEPAIVSNPSVAIQDDLAISDTDEEDNNLILTITKEEPTVENNEGEAEGDLWF